MPWRDVFRLKRRGRRRSRREDEHGLTEDDVRRLHSMQRASRSAVKVVRRDQ
jgi:hypothetical protein